MQDERLETIDFSALIDRVGTNSFKWDLVRRRFGEDVLPMWVADMDFATCPKVIEALKRRISHPVFGYTIRGDEYYDAIIKWYAGRYGCEIEREWIVNGPGVVPMIAFLINALTEPGDKIVIQPPVYPPFFRVVQNNGRVLALNPLALVEKNGEPHWKMDLRKLEELIDEGVKMLILCNPHNPVGRVWSESELRELYGITQRRGVIVISDEIHADIVYKPHRFTTFLKIGLENVIVLNSPGKTFNIAGLTNSYGIVADERIRKAYNTYLEKMEMLLGNALSLEALKEAYNCEDWLDGLLDYLRANRDYAIDYIHQHMPLLRAYVPEGTYLLWIECCKLPVDSPHRFFLERARVYLSDGAEFGDQRYVRLNFACPRTTLEEGLERMRRAYEGAFELIVLNATEPQFAECERIRMTVFHNEQGIPTEEDFDGCDGEAVHFLVKLLGVPIATARARNIGAGTWKIERVAVLSEYRRAGVGAKLMGFIEEHLRGLGAEKLVLHAQEYVRGFYEKLGYRVSEGPFLEAGILHVACEKILAQSGIT